MGQTSIGQIEAYRKEVFNFLHTVTLKFDPFSYTLGRDYMDQYGLGEDEIHQEWNPYYQNLCGQYAYYDTPIIIYSIEEEKDVVLTREYLETHPRTATLYRIPNPEYDTLCKKYPKQTGLIKSIIYPAKDIRAVIDAQDFDILNCDASLLFEGERESLVSALSSFLTMVRTRWWVPEYMYEDLYPMGFWMLLWQSLPNVLLSQRILNIKTGASHPFHLWEYLQSKGLDDYRDILSMNQSQWLYRNMDWILKNKGKHDTLIELEKNILDEVQTDLGGVILKPNTDNSIDNCLPDIEIIVKDVDSGEIIDQYPGGSLIDKIEDEGLTPPTDQDEKKDILDDLAKTDQDDIQTKYLEFVKETIDTRWENLLTEFLFDTLMYRYHNNDLHFTVKLYDVVSNGAYNLYVGDAIALLYYALHRQFNVEVFDLPTSVSTRICYQKHRVTRDMVPKGFTLFHSPYYVDNYVDTETMLNRIPYFSNRFTDFVPFIDLQLEQFKCLLRDVQTVISSGHALYQEAMCHVYGHLLVRQEHLPIRFGGPSVNTYNDLRKISPDMDTILNAYESSTTKQSNYVWLADTLMRTLFPLTDARFAKLIGMSEYLEKLYQGLKDLFMKLSSYNVCFLDKERKKYDYIEMPTHVTHLGGASYTGRPIVYPVGTWDVVKNGIHTGVNAEIDLGSDADLFDGSRLTTRDVFGVNTEIITSSAVQKTNDHISIGSSITITL